MKKTFMEKMGDTLGHLGKRFLIFGAMTAVGVLFSFILPFLIFIGAPLLFIGGFGMVSVLEKRKSYLVRGITVKGTDGKEIPCAILMQKHYCFMPIIPLVSLFYYIPYKKQYYLIKNVTAKTPEKPLRINNAVLGSMVLKAEPITYGEYNSLLSDPDSFYSKLLAESEKDRNAYAEDVSHFIGSGIFEEIRRTENEAVIRTKGGTYILLHYSRGEGGQRGIVINKELYEKLEEDSSELFMAYIEVPKLFENTVELNDALLERLLHASEYKPHLSSEGAKRAQEEVDSDKTVITKEMIANALKSKFVTSKLVWGIFWCFMCVLLAVCGIAGGIITILMFSVAGGGFAGFLGVNYIIEHRKNKRMLAEGTYKILKVPCVKIEDTSDSESTSFDCIFANGERISGGSPVCIVGDCFYFVYPGNIKSTDVYYNAMSFIPAPDLEFSDYVA